MAVQKFKPSKQTGYQARGSTYDCEKCGRTWTCSPKDCWCEKLSIRLPVPNSPNTSCLCPCEIEALSKNITHR